MRERAFLCHQVDDLAQEEGLPSVSSKMRSSTSLRGSTLARALMYAADLVARQAAQHDAVEAGLAVERRQRLRQRALARDVGVAVGADDQHAHARELAGDVLQQMQRRLVGPVQVVERDDERPCAAIALQYCA